MRWHRLLPPSGAGKHHGQCVTGNLHKKWPHYTQQLNPALHSLLALGLCRPGLGSRATPHVDPSLYISEVLPGHSISAEVMTEGMCSCSRISFASHVSPVDRALSRCGWNHLLSVWQLRTGKGKTATSSCPIVLSSRAGSQGALAEGDCEHGGERTRVHSPRQYWYRAPGSGQTVPDSWDLLIPLLTALCKAADALQEALVWHCLHTVQVY